MSATSDLYETGGTSPPTAELEAQIQAELAARRGVLNLARKQSYSHSLEIGRLLVQLKDATEHGEFLPALARCGLSERSASRYMRLHNGHVADVSTIREAEAVIGERRLALPYHHRHEAENLRKVRAVDPELADKVDAGEVSLREAMQRTRPQRIRKGKTREGERVECDRRRRVELLGGVQAPPDLIEKWRKAWASLNVTEAEVEEVERAVETWQESLRILNAAQRRVLDVYPKGAREKGPAAPMGGNYDDRGKAFRHLFETNGIGDGTLAVPTASG